jgi:hypothetical protein
MGFEITNQEAKFLLELLKKNDAKESGDLNANSKRELAEELEKYLTEEQL